MYFSDPARLMFFEKLLEFFLEIVIHINESGKRATSQILASSQVPLEKKAAEM